MNVVATPINVRARLNNVYDPLISLSVGLIMTASISMAT